MIISLYILFAVSIVLIEIFRPKVRTIDFLSFFNLYIFLGYAIQGIFLNYDYHEYFPTSFRFIKDVKPIVTNNYFVFGLIVTGYFFAIVGYYYSSKVSDKAKLITIRPNFYKHIHNHVFWVAVVCVIINIICIIIIIRKQGNLLTAFAMTFIERNNSHDELRFVIHFILIGLLPTFMMLGYLRNFKGSLKTYLIVGLLVILQLISHLLDGGRSNLVVFIFTMYFIINNGNIKIDKKVITILAAFILILGLKDITAALYLSTTKKLAFSDAYTAVKEKGKKHGEQTTLSKVVEEFHYPFVSMHCSIDYVINNPNSELRYFSDVINSPFYLVPERLTGISLSPQSMAEHNTYQVLGINDSNTPPGVMAFFIYNLSIPGLFIGMFLFGHLGKILHNLFYYNISIKNYWMEGVYFYYALPWAMFVLNGEPRVEMFGYLPNIGYLIFLICFKFKYD